MVHLKAFLVSKTNNGSAFKFQCNFKPHTMGKTGVNSIDIEKGSQDLVLLIGSKFFGSKFFGSKFIGIKFNIC